MQLPRISSDYAFINVKQIVYYTERRGGRNSETNRMPARIRASCRPRHKLVLEADARLIAESRNTNSKLSRERYSTPTNSPRVPRRNSRGGIVRVAGQKRIGAVWKRGDELVPRFKRLGEKPVRVFLGDKETSTDVCYWAAGAKSKIDVACRSNSEDCSLARRVARAISRDHAERNAKTRGVLSSLYVFRFLTLMDTKVRLSWLKFPVFFLIRENCDVTTFPYSRLYSGTVVLWNEKLFSNDGNSRCSKLRVLHVV